MELEIKHIVPYLPYGLKVLRPDNRTVLDVVGIDNNMYIFSYNRLENVTYGSFNTSKLILRPLSAITKEIDNGERFVPLIELFKLSNGNFQQEIRYHSVMATTQIQIEMLGFRNYFFGLFESHRDIRIENGLYFHCYSTDLAMDDRKEEKIFCQYSLFLKLLEWHFDIFGLIDANLAIDVNTLDINPYENNKS